MYRTAFSILHNNQDAAALNEALSRLPENYREVLIMYYYHNMPLESVAGTFGISYEGAKAKLSGARNGSSRSGDNGK